MTMPIYLDYNAGAPIRPEAREAVQRAVEHGYGNPASVHRFGQRARRELEKARAAVAKLIGAAPAEVVFTSGGTESNNLAIFGAVGGSASRRRIVSSAIEHSSVLSPLAELESRGFAVVRLAPDPQGRIDPDEVGAALDGNTALVSLGLANSEVGTIQDVAGLSAPIAAVGALFHIDAAQALGRIALDAGALGCDLMTLSAHKVGAPAGTGALYVRDRARLRPRLLGGPQEAGLRAGTPNLIGAIAFGAACAALHSCLEGEAARVSARAARLLGALCESIPGLRLNGPVDGRLPNTLNLGFPGVLGESMLIALDLEGVAVSMGSACAAGAFEPSHVLRAMGRSAAEARSSLRLSLGWASSAGEVDRAGAIIARVWRRVCAAEPQAGARAAEVETGG